MSSPTHDKTLIIAIPTAISILLIAAILSIYKIWTMLPATKLGISSGKTPGNDNSNRTWYGRKQRDESTLPVREKSFREQHLNDLRAWKQSHTAKRRAEMAGDAQLTVPAPVHDAHHGETAQRAERDLERGHGLVVEGGGRGETGGLKPPPASHTGGGSTR
ncbi:hypothetical protein P153DRAFT_432621 [Dothidotthia symphoricarpi CBS 119687]|uniref:Uncharacterized protein n=1 Tax=Dothidotthia symphoricarpi CBS 119687 TaxID=1392245 RepID=A0A6A6A9G7_9PLEO|nr:uncharacterized protein P153DRAFT_432621 [Dothidotthia symphoricarpi CBS 119687]KAF2127488.1 hypothetical protein P153DRAFT_432621 [Dothidotthia symphoricarpi CBS 119687]